MQFFETSMGKRYFQHTMPSIARALEKIADLLAKDDAAAFSEDDRRQLAQALKAFTAVSKVSAQSDFFARVGGRRFYETVMPKIRKQLEEIAKMGQERLKAAEESVRPMEAPLTQEEMKRIADSDDFAYGVISVSLSNLIDNDIEWLNDLASEKMTGTLLLMDIGYGVAGCNPETNEVYIQVWGDVSECISD